MDFKFENQGTNTFLVYEIQMTDDIDSMSLGMLTNNKIPGFADVSFTQMDAIKYIKYNVSAKVAVSDLFSGPVNKKRLIGVLTGIVNAMLSAEEYMLDPQTIVLDLKYIYTDVTTCETVLICVPVLADEIVFVDLGAFFKNILFTTQFDQTENCDHVAKIINFLNSAAAISLEDFKELLETIANQDKPKVIQAKQQPVVKRDHTNPVVQPLNEQSQSAIELQLQPMAANRVEYSAEMSFVDSDENSDSQNAQEHKPMEAEKPMTMFYLLQHYSKENAAKYKAQQDAKKAQKNAGNKKAEKSAPAKIAKASDARMNPGFAIPGQETSNSGAGFAIPGKQPDAVPQQPVQSQQPARQPAYQSQPVQAPAPQYVQQPASGGSAISFGETTVLGGRIGETTVLGNNVDASKPNPHLVRARNNEIIPLNKPVFRIGKERSYVDYFISDNTAVSRSHANIVNRDGEFFVVDTNSTNHTYVNGGMIPSNVETRLSHGSKLRLANEDFEFKMY